LIGTQVNIKTHLQTDPQLLEHFKDTYMTVAKDQKTQGMRFGQLLTLAKTLAKAENYDNLIMDLMYHELKHIMVFNASNRGMSPSQK
jgi:predicted SprT family Zn-dependent metalloprotease